MPTSATSGRRQAHKGETERRIHHCALALTDERGVDGWTMDELADAANVSRRTLFNYYACKVDAVLSGPPDIPDDALDAFHRGGPTGRVLDDLLVLAEALMAESSDTILTKRRVLAASPRLLAIERERFETIMQELGDHVLRREGAAFGSTRARLLVHLLVSIFDASLHQLGELQDGRPLAELFDHNVRQARDLLA